MERDPPRCSPPCAGSALLSRRGATNGAVSLAPVRGRTPSRAIVREVVWPVGHEGASRETSLRVRVRAGLHTYGAEEVAAASRRKVPQRLPHLLHDARGFSAAGRRNDRARARGEKIVGRKEIRVVERQFYDARFSKGDLD